MALKKQHKARWNCNMGKYQPGRGTWPTPQNGKWPYLKFRLGTYISPPPPPYLSNTPTNLCMALFNFSFYFLFFILILFEQNFNDNTMPSINLSSGVLDKPHLIVLLTRQMPNKVIVTRLSWEMMKIDQAKTKFKTEWKGSYPVKRTLGDPFSFYVFPKPVDKPPGFLTLISFGVERFARGPLFKWSPH